MSTARLMQMGAAGIGYHPRPVINVGDVSSTYLYTGNGSTQTITNGIDLAGEGGLVWNCRRGAVVAITSHELTDTERGSKSLSTTAADAQVNSSDVTAFNSNGFSLTAGNTNRSNYNTEQYVSWTFRKAPKFFDCIQYSGNGVSGREIAHNLNCEVGSIFVKKISAAENWMVFHNSLGTSNDGDGFIRLNTTGAGDNRGRLLWGDGTNYIAPTSSVFTLHSDASVNASGSTYVAYVFAHNGGTGEFGPSYDQDIITCSSYTGNGSSQTVDCNFTSGAKFVLIKRTDSTGDWYMWDAQRGIVPGNDPFLKANTNGAEVTTDDSLDADATGFIVNQNTTTNINVSSANYIFCAIA
tara:strand:- start:1948 stop:3006 length:1059 start_codon:yes stop_codon:yes gene_type:complete